VIGALNHNIAAVLFAIRQGGSLCFADCDEGDQGVNYLGRISFGGFYNPFGSVITPGVEINPGSNFLDFVVNIATKATVSKFGVCYANPQSAPGNHALAFNPLINGEPALEPGRLQAWTNMANTTTAKNGNKAANGPDIHPTPLGYEILAQGYAAECGV